MGKGYVGVAGRWAGALGEDGLAEYRRLAEARWPEVPVAGPVYLHRGPAASPREPAALPGHPPRGRHRARARTRRPATVVAGCIHDT
jgi:hypothetical protein